jgi:hypothetical protein
MFIGRERLQCVVCYGAATQTTQWHSVEYTTITEHQLDGLGLRRVDVRLAGRVSEVYYVLLGVAVAARTATEKLVPTPASHVPTAAVFFDALLAIRCYGATTRVLST